MPPRSIFELTVHDTEVENTFRLVAELTRPNEPPIEREETFGLDPELQGIEDPQEYGEALGRMVFTGGVRGLFDEALRDDLCVLLEVRAKPMRPPLRWERLAGPFDGDAWQPLALNQRTPFSLYLPSASNRRFLPFGRADLEALVVVASPPADNRFKLGPFDEAAALDTVLTGLDSIPSTVLGKDPRAVGPPTLTEICTRLTDERHTLLHLVAHGAFSSWATGETAVFLDGDDGGPTPVPASLVIDRLRALGSGHGLPHMAFLAVCDSAKPEAEMALGGLGQRLVRDLGMPAVVAMTGPVSQVTALTLGTELYRHLRNHGEVDRALVEACVKVHERQDVVVPALYSRLVGRPLFTEALERPLTPAELSAAAERIDALFAERAPVLQPDARRLAATVAQGSEPLVGEAKAEYDRAFAGLVHLCEGALELSFTALAHGESPPPYGVRCPFAGPKPLTADEHEFFLGREALVESMLKRLEERPFLAVVGRSGCGKSSLVEAGLIPRMKQELPTLELLRLQPDHHPLAQLEPLRARLQERPDAVVHVDPFEAVFLRCGDEAERTAFFDALLALSDGGTKVVVSMRSDFIADCMEHPVLHHRITRDEPIPAMSVEQLRQAIEGQSKAAGLRCEAGLCEWILEDIGKEPGAMSLVQHTLLEIYARRHGRWLRVDAYEDLQQIPQIVARMAEREWDALDLRDQDRLRAVMLELTTVVRPEGDEPIRYLRRLVPLEDLYLSKPLEAPALRRLIDRLADARLLVKGYDPRLGAVVEVAHEKLLYAWDVLGEWLEAAKEAIGLRQELEESAEAWYGHGRGPEYLEHVGERGDQVRWYLHSGALTLTPGVQAYFHACEQEEQRRRQQREQQIEALTEAKNEALAQRDRARYATWLAYVRMFKAEDPTRAALALRCFESKVTTAWLQDTLDTLQQPIAQVLLVGHRYDVCAASFSPDGRRVVTASRDGTARVWNADGSGAPVVLHGHMGHVVAASFSPDGLRIVTAAYDDTARVWSADGRGEPVVLRGHDDDVISASFSPDGTRVLTVSHDRAVRVWPADGRGEPISLMHQDWVVAASFGPQGQRVVTASEDGSIRVWRIDRAEVEHVLAGHRQRVTSVCFSRDGLRIISTSADTTARVWSADGRGVPVVLAGHDAPIHAASLSPDGQHVVTASRDQTARIWKVDGEGDSIVLRGHRAEIYAASFSPDGTRVVTASYDRTARVWSADGRGEPLVLRGHQDELCAASFAPEGARVLTASRDRTARVWNVRGSGVPVVLRGHGHAVGIADFSPDGARVVTASTSREDTARIWRSDGRGAPVVLRGHQDPVLSASFSPDGTRIVTTSHDRTARVWDVSSGAAVMVLRGHERGIRAASFGPNGQRIVTASHDGTARVWDASSGVILAVLRGHERGVCSARFSPDGTRVVTASHDWTACVWDAGGGPGTVLRGHGNDVWTARFSPDGRKIVTASYDHTARVWDVNGQGEPVVLAGHRSTVISARFSPDGRRVVTASWDDTARVWGADGSGAPILLEGHRGRVASASFSPDGRRVVTASLDGTARVWTVDGGDAPLVLRGHRQGVESASFSPDGKSVVTASADGTAWVWPLDPAALRAHLEAASAACIPEQDRVYYLGQTPQEAREAFEACERSHGR